MADELTPEEIDALIDGRPYTPNTPDTPDTHATSSTPSTPSNTPEHLKGRSHDVPDDPDDPAKKLQRELSSLADYRRALEQEFANIDSTDENISAKAMDAIIKLVPDAGEAVSFLLNHAASEGVRAGLAKWVFDKVLKQLEREGDEDEMAKLVKSLQGSGE